MSGPETSGFPARSGSGLAAELRTGWVYLLRALQSRFAYTGAYVWDVGVAFMAFLSVILVWTHVNGKGGLPESMPAGGLFAYLTLVYALNFGFGNWLEFLLGRRVRTGQIATDMLKPIDFQWMQFCGVLGEMIPQCVVGGLILTLGYWVLPLAPLSGLAAHPLACMASFVLALIIQFGICFLFSLLAFVTHFGYGAFTMRMAMHFMLSGMMGPLALFQPGLRDLAASLPFIHVLHTPASLLLGWVRGADAWWLVGQQAAWAAGTVLAGRIMLGLLVRKLVIQGG